MPYERACRIGWAYVDGAPMHGPELSQARRVLQGRHSVDSRQLLDMMGERDAGAVGYVCKRCGGPAPVGVGYVSHAVDDAHASQGRMVCPCGYSMHPDHPDAPAEGVRS